MDRFSFYLISRDIKGQMYWGFPLSALSTSKKDSNGYIYPIPGELGKAEEKGDDGRGEHGGRAW